ncbi:MAG: hypothetical protein HZA52_14895 [Planctomycetes bacterium]|nr:hypothetical protein [Planctomycetota bacterium]
MSRRPQPSRPRSVRIALALLVFVVGWFANGWHVANAHHEICADHGELLEVADAPHCVDAGHQALHLDDGPSLSATHGDVGEHHEHCAFVSLSNPASVLDAFRVDGFHAESPRRETVLDEPWRDDGARLFLLAPKQSPPLRGTSQA